MADPVRNRFCRYQLRSLDVDGAHVFYSALFGDRFWTGGVELAPLPAAAAARGVPGYWLGHIATDDVVRRCTGSSTRARPGWDRRHQMAATRAASCCAIRSAPSSP